MSDAARKQQENKAKLDKIVEKYKHRFENTIVDFKKFIETRVIFDDAQKDSLYKIIQQRVDESFDSDELQDLLHIVSAHQAGKSIGSMTKKELKSFYKIKFISKKGQQPQIPKKEEQPTQNARQQEKEKREKELELRKRKEKQAVLKKLEEEKIAQAKKEEERNGPHNYEEVVQISDDEPEGNHNGANKKYISTIRENEHLNTIVQESESSMKNTEEIFPQYENDLDPMPPKNDREHTERIKSDNYMSQPAEWVTDKLEKKQETQRIEYEIAVDPNLEGEEVQDKFEENSKTIQNQCGVNRNSHQIAEDLTMDEEVVSITRYEKTGQDFMNPIIKFQINFKNEFTTWRRYSQIQRLMGYLRKKYQGVVLPEMPPKEGLKGGLTYLWGIDETFLFERREKLNTMLNRLMNKNEINKDPKLIKFLTDENYEIPAENTDDYWQAITGWKDFVLNYNQLKDYGVAYYKFVSEYKNKPLTTELAGQYEELEEEIRIIRAADEHRRKINANFDSRRQIMYNFKVAVRQPVKTELDKILEKASIECKEIAIEYANYVQLKSNESWLSELKKQKQQQEGTKSMAKIQNDLEQTKKRIKKIEENFSVSIKQYKKKLALILQNLGGNMIEWRKKIHP